MNINSQIIRNVRNELYDLGKTTAEVNIIIENNFAQLSSLDEDKDHNYKDIAIGLIKSTKK